jgi:hypothetical protein
MYFPSGLQAQHVTLVLAPRSFDLTTMTCFCFRLLLTSHILQGVSQHRQLVGVVAHLSVESLEQVTNWSLSVGWKLPPLISAV